MAGTSLRTGNMLEAKDPRGQVRFDAAGSTETSSLWSGKWIKKIKIERADSTRKGLWT
jgi:hypothetical protein